MGNQQNIVAVIGGGAAGLVAAIEAARNGAVVTIYERSARVGRKLLSTGNGRCNLSNRHLGTDHYHGKTPAFVEPAMAAYPLTETLDFFNELGIMIIEEDGKLFPRSLQAAAVLDGLRLECDRLGIQTQCDCEITAIHPLKHGGFTLQYAHGSGYAQRVIVATGGMASASLGGCDLGYRLLSDLGHHCTPLQPAIVQLKCDTRATKALSGIKIEARLTLYQERTTIAAHQGELLFTDYGLSGPPILLLSSYATRLLAKHRGLSIGIDMTPEWSEAMVMDILQKRIALRPEVSLEDFMVGILHKRLGQITLKAAGIAPLSRKAETLTPEEIAAYAALLKDWRIIVQDTNGMKQAQVTAGGIATAEFDSATMASCLVAGLYACGEVLDIDGDCGGYNLQWAWSSGRLAGREAALS